MKNLIIKHKKMTIGVIVVLSGILLTIMAFFFALRPIDDEKSITFSIEPNTSTVDIINNLKESGLIRSTLATKIYKTLKIGYLQAGDYLLNPAMGTKEILKTIANGYVIDAKGIAITFIEGKRITDYAKQINQKLGISEEEFYGVFKDEKFLKEMIKKYWFLDDTILNSELYYSLEGYLFPNTYFFDKNTTAKDVVIKMLDETNNKLVQYQEQILNNAFSTHEILTIASMVELETASYEDRMTVASIFINRVNKKMSLGSDVTTYYAEKFNISDRGLKQSELNNCNNYNTRCNSFIGLPIGPIGNPGLVSIKAVLNHEDSIYYYFVSDKNGKMYYNKDEEGHQDTIDTLKSKNLWYNY